MKKNVESGKKTKIRKMYIEKKKVERTKKESKEKTTNKQRNKHNTEEHKGKKRKRKKMLVRGRMEESAGNTGNTHMTLKLRKTSLSYKGEEYNNNSNIKKKETQNTQHPEMRRDEIN